MTTAASVPALVLSTSAPAPRHVVIDGKPYALRYVDSLTLSQSVEHDRLRLRTQILWKEEMTDEEEAALEAILEQLTALALDAPAEVLAKLTAAQRMAVVVAFWHVGTSSKHGRPSKTYPKLGQVSPHTPTPPPNATPSRKRR